MAKKQTLRNRNFAVMGYTYIILAILLFLFKDFGVNEAGEYDNSAIIGWSVIAFVTLAYLLQLVTVFLSVDKKGEKRIVLFNVPLYSLGYIYILLEVAFGSYTILSDFNRWKWAMIIQGSLALLYLLILAVGAMLRLKPAK